MTRVPEILTPGKREEAIAALRDYYRNNKYGRPIYSGSQFETIGHRWNDPATANVITAYDVLSLSTLSVPAKGGAALRLLEKQFQDVASTLLEQIPLDATIIDDDSYHRYLKEGSPGDQLWKLILETHQIGPVSTSKLMARKRAHLFPVKDGLVKEGWDLSGFWSTLRRHIRRNGLWDHAISLGDEAKVPPYVSPLRILDIVVWKTEANRVSASKKPASTSDETQVDQATHQPA